MSTSVPFHKIWVVQCIAAEDLHENFGRRRALDYLIREKLFTFVHTAEQDADFAAELPLFVAEIQRLFSPGEIREYLEDLEPQHLDQSDEYAWPEDSLSGIEKMVLLGRVRQLLK